MNIFWYYGSMVADNVNKIFCSLLTPAQKLKSFFSGKHVTFLKANKTENKRMRVE